MILLNIAILILILYGLYRIDKKLNILINAMSINDDSSNKENLPDKIINAVEKVKLNLEAKKELRKAETYKKVLRKGFITRKEEKLLGTKEELF